MSEAEFCCNCGFNMELHRAVNRVGDITYECPPSWPGSANLKQVGAEDYKDGGYAGEGKIQHWDFAASQGFDYFQGQITKYVTRWKSKGGMKDLEKAQHFLEKYIELVRDGVVKP